MSELRKKIEGWKDLISEDVRCGNCKHWVRTSFYCCDTCDAAGELEGVCALIQDKAIRFGKKIKKSPFAFPVTESWFCAAFEKAEGK